MNLAIAEEKPLAEQIADQLRRDILRGKLAPGATIKERDNAAEMGVSRTPLREAIRILSQEGLVDLRPARSPIVAVPSIKQVSDDVEVLLGIEILSAELACMRASDEEIAEIAALQQHITDRFDAADPLDLFEIDMQFHRAIALAAHNMPLADIHRTFQRRLWRGRFMAAIKRRNRTRVVEHHNEILESLRQRNPVLIRASILNHIGNLKNDILESIRKDQETAPNE
jgi:DNA-binding GntR family transcriptional regulator